MPNEEEVIVDPDNEEEVVEEAPEKEIPVPEVKEEKPKEEKPTETPEAKVARLKRQLKQAMKHAGIVEEPTNVPALDPLEIATFTSAVKDYTPEELEFIVQNASDKSPKGIIEASKKDMVQMAIQAKREKVDKEKQILATSTKQPDVGKPKSTEEKIVEASKKGIEDLGEILREKGLYKDPHRRPDRVIIK